MTSQADTASKFAPPRSPRGSLLRGLARRPALLTLLAALAVLALASLLLDQTVRLALLLTAAILVAALALRQAAALPLAGRRALRRGGALAAAEDDPIPCLLADRAGRPLGRNRAAREVGLDHEELARRLAPHVADPPSLLADLTDTARRGGTASWADPARPQAPPCRPGA